MGDRTHRKTVVVHDEHELYHDWSDLNLSSAVRETIDGHLLEQGRDPARFRWAVDTALEEGYSFEDLRDLGSYQGLLELLRYPGTAEDLGVSDHSDAQPANDD